MRVHIFGASGSGTTTLARALASKWSIPCHDIDDYYWLPTDPPFKQKRPVEERVALMHALFVARPHWVLSGGMLSWGEDIRERYQLVVFLTLDDQTRQHRLAERETQRHGANAIAPGGHAHDHYMAFMEWAAQYEDPDFNGRSRQRHEAWMRDLSCPCIRLNSLNPVTTLVDQVEAAWESMDIPD
ncbi:MAG: AAA family ATPase [Pseudomonadota bacterium]